jgi:exopolysaccharide biosynthesis polyprenyl glycosylphosphotransferase
MRREGAYDVRRTRPLFDELYGVLNATTTAIMLMIVFVFFYRSLFYSRIIFVYAGILILALVGAARLVRRLILGRLRQAGQGVDRLLIVGAGEVGRAVMRNIIAQPELGYQIVGFLDDDPAKSHTDIGPIKALGPVENLPQVLKTLAISQVIITLPWQYHRKTVRLVLEAEDAGARARVVPDLFQLSLGGVDVETINGIPLISIKQTALTGWNLVVKRALDLVFSALFVMLTAPLWLIIAIAIKLDSPGPVLFKQERAGKNGRPFKVYKFRSMVVGAEAEQQKLLAQNEASGPLFKMRDDPRRTRVGRFLRQTSLDQIPKFITVLRVLMSGVAIQQNGGSSQSSAHGVSCESGFT